MTVAAHAAPSDPGRVALDFLEKVRLGNLNLEPGGDTALSAQTAEGKKLQIARNLKRMARDLGDDPLEVGPVKLDDNFAAVLVRKVGGFDPSRLRIFPVALVKRGAEWAAAPVPASFENSGTGYAIELRERLERLENWMLRGQVIDLEQLRESSAKTMREKIERHLPSQEVRRMDPLQFTESFLAACARKDLPSMLGFLGGLSTKLPVDWHRRLRAVEKAVDTTNSHRPWRLLTSPDVARAIVAHEGGESHESVIIACLDPAGSGAESTFPEIELIDIELSKSGDDLWQINPPHPFLRSNEDTNDLIEQVDGETERVNEFPAQWIKSNPLQRKPSAEQARQAFLDAAATGSFPRLLAVSNIDSGSAVAARKSCIQAAKIGWTIQDPNAARHVMPLAFTASDSTAVGLFQFFSARDPNRFDPQDLYFEKSTSGWSWSPRPAKNTRKEFRDWVNAETSGWQGKWQQKLLEDTPVIRDIDSLSAPSIEDSRVLVEKWLDATRRSDVTTALQLVACLDTPQSRSTALQNLGYEITSSRHGTVSPATTSIYQGNTWTAVGAKLDHSGKTIYPLYPIIHTSQGPRILIEIDLFATQNRGREFLNKVAIERLAESTSTHGELQNLNARHQADVEDLNEFVSHGGPAGQKKFK